MHTTDSKSDRSREVPPRLDRDYVTTQHVPCPLRSGARAYMQSAALAHCPEAALPRARRTLTAEADAPGRSSTSCFDPHSRAPRASSPRCSFCGLASMKRGRAVAPLSSSEAVQRATVFWSRAAPSTPINTRQASAGKRNIIKWPPNKEQRIMGPNYSGLPNL